MLPSVLLVWRLVACRVYIALWRVLGVLPGAFGAFRGYGPRVLLSAFCAAFKGAAGPIGAASPPARYILSGVCRASGRGCRSCCFPQLARLLLMIGAASLVNLLRMLRGICCRSFYRGGLSLWLCIWPFAAR